MNRGICLLPSLVAGLLGCAYGQAPLSQSDKQQTISTFTKEFRSHYVFPDLAEKASKVLEEHLSAHDYDSISDGDKFAHLLTDQLREICNDAHLHLSYSAEALPTRKAASVPSPEEIRQRNTLMHFYNAGFERVERLGGNIGYLEVRGFMDPNAVKRPLHGAMELLEDTDALILDLRRNGGGEPESVRMLCSYFFDKPVHLNDLVDKNGKVVYASWTGKVAAAKYLNKPVYVLTGKRTGSGAEECAYNLQTTKRATIVGESTWGGANPGDDYRLNDHFSAFIPFARANNPVTNKNWEGTGVTPDVNVPADKSLLTAQQLALKELIGRATDPAVKKRLQRALESLSP